MLPLVTRLSAQIEFFFPLTIVAIVALTIACPLLQSLIFVVMWGRIVVYFAALVFHAELLVFGIDCATLTPWTPLSLASVMLPSCACVITLLLIMQNELHLHNERTIVRRAD